MKKKNLAIILAGGSGERFKGDIPKQFLKLAGKTVIEHTIDVFEKSRKIDAIYIVVNPHYYNQMLSIVEKSGYKKVRKILKGGNSRQESSKIGIFAADDNFENVLIHDAVRPFVSDEIIERVIKGLKKYNAVDTAVSSPDTIIKINKKSEIEFIPERKFLKRGQTPQGFKLKIIKKAHELSEKEVFLGATDDCSLVLKYGLSKVLVVDGSNDNIKITYPIDIYIADKIFQVKNENVKKIKKSVLKKKIKGKVFVVFGGFSGIGKEIVKIINENSGIAYPFSRKNGVDIRNYNSIKKALSLVYEKEKRISCVIVSSGVLELGFIETASIKHIKEIAETNYTGAIFVSKAAIKYLKESSGSIIFFASSSYTRGRAGYSVYSSSKAAIVNYAQALSDELSKYGIRVNVVNPERTKTPMRFRAFGKEDERTLLSPEFVAYNTLNIALSNITGQVFDIKVADEKGL